MTRRLLVNPDTPNEWEIHLLPGIIRVGRSDENDCKIDHPSVSGAHCEIIAEDTNVTVKDLGSINGTFVNNTLVEEAVLSTGQMLRLGDVVMRYEADAPPAVSPVSVAPATPAVAGTVCKSHPKAIARFYCARCADAFCELCVYTRMADGRKAKYCRACGAECAPLSAPPTQAEDVPTFRRLLGGAFAYPFRHNGAILLVTGTIFYTMMDVLSGFVMFLGLVLSIIGTGYLVSYMQRILVASAMGEDQMPDWPDFTDWSDIYSPLLQFIGTFAVSFGPVIALNIFASENAPWLSWAFPAALVLGCVYFPMGFTAVAMFDSLAALNPFLVISSILKIPAAYLLAVALLLGAYATGSLADRLLEEIFPLPILPGLLARFFGLYLMTVEMRILGLLYRTKKGQLGWFSR